MTSRFKLKRCECCNYGFRKPVNGTCPNCQGHDWLYVDEETTSPRTYEEVFYQVVFHNPTATLEWQVQEARRIIEKERAEGGTS